MYMFFIYKTVKTIDDTSFMAKVKQNVILRRLM